VAKERKRIQGSVNVDYPRRSIIKCWVSAGDQRGGVTLKGMNISKDSLNRIFYCWMKKRKGLDNLLVERMKAMYIPYQILCAILFKFVICCIPCKVTLFSVGCI
jgi:hypothetical protein